MRELKKHLGVSPGKTTTMADLAYLLFLMGDFGRAIDFCKKLLHSVPNNLSLTTKCYNIMGQAYKNEPNLALQSFENELKLQLQYDPNDFCT